MRVVLTLFTLNHLGLLWFESFIYGVMEDPVRSGAAPGYGIVYALLIFPFQFMFELSLIVALIYQVFIVRRWQANIVFWLASMLTFVAIF